MRLYMVRRTRSFIQDNYATTDLTTGRKYLTFPDGRRSYFPTRQPQTVTFTIDDHDAHDQYALLYSTPIVDTINALTLPRYRRQLHQGAATRATQRCRSPRDRRSLRAGKRLMGFSASSLFKRLEAVARRSYIHRTAHPAQFCLPPCP